MRHNFSYWSKYSDASMKHSPGLFQHHLLKVLANIWMSSRPGAHTISSRQTGRQIWQDMQLTAMSGHHAIVFCFFILMTDSSRKVAFGSNLHGWRRLITLGYRWVGSWTEDLINSCRLDNEAIRFWSAWLLAAPPSISWLIQSCQMWWDDWDANDARDRESRMWTSPPLSCL